MALFTLLRFLLPNASVAVSEAGGDLTTTAALGQAIENLDTYAARINGTNTFTSANTFSALQTFSGGISPDGSHTATIPSVTDTLVGKTTTDTLTNKTLTSPVINVTSDATGDIYYRNAGGLFTRLAVGTSAQYLQGGTTPAWASVLNTVTNTLGSNTVLNSTSTFFDGPSCGQGTSGTWLAVGQVTITDTAGAASFVVKLWDGTTVIAAVLVDTSAASKYATVAVSGVLATPAANIKISVKDITSTSGKITFNDAGSSKDSTLTVTRIA